MTLFGAIARFRIKSILSFTRFLDIAIEQVPAAFCSLAIPRPFHAICCIPGHLKYAVPLYRAHPAALEIYHATIEASTGYTYYS